MISTSALPPPLLMILAPVIFWLTQWGSDVESKITPIPGRLSEFVEITNTDASHRSLIPASNPDFADAVEKTLLLPSRQPWIEPVQIVEPLASTTVSPPIVVQQPAEAAVLAAPKISYLGNVVTSESLRALITHGPEQTERWVAIGEQLESWSVVEIRPTEILLISGEQEIVVKIRR